MKDGNLFGLAWQRIWFRDDRRRAERDEDLEGLVRPWGGAEAEAGRRNLRQRDRVSRRTLEIKRQLDEEVKKEAQ